MPDRWDKTQQILKDFSEIKFKTYNGVGHEVNLSTINDIVNFFSGTGLTNILDESYDSPVKVDFTNIQGFNDNNVEAEVATPPVPKKSDFDNVQQFYKGVTVSNGKGHYSKALEIKINRNKIPKSMSTFYYFRTLCYPIYTPEYARMIMAEAKARNELNLKKYDDNLEYNENGSFSCYVFLYDINKNPLGFAIIKDCVVQIPDAKP